MLRINQNSKEHKKKNILILDKDFDDLVKEGIIKDKDMIRGGMFPFEFEEDLLERITGGDGIKETLIRLILGVLVTGEKPFQSVLLTTKQGLEEYKVIETFK